MSSSSTKTGLGRWVIRAAFLAIAGAVLSFAVLFLASTLLPAVLGGRIVRAGTATTIVVWLSLLLAMVGLMTLLLVRSIWGCFRSLLLVISWWAIFFLLIVFSQRFGSLPLPLYLAVWIASGAIGSTLLQQPPRTSPSRAAGPMTGNTVRLSSQDVPPGMSAWGRIPARTVTLVRQHTVDAAGIASALPGADVTGYRATATAVIITVVLRDWWQNGNQAGLTDLDRDDLASFVRLAWHTSQAVPTPAIAHAVFRAVLTALLDDWCVAWNTGNMSGPPQWQQVAG
ncbi:MAG: hypothetical protein NVS2B7_29380 [Herpetosiphon sp.]